MNYQTITKVITENYYYFITIFNHRKLMEGQSKGSRVLEVYCKGGEGPPRAVALSKKKKNHRKLLLFYNNF